MIEKLFSTEAPLSIKSAWLCPDQEGNDGSLVFVSNDDSKVVVPRKLVSSFREFIIKVEKEVKKGK